MATDNKDSTQSTTRSDAKDDNKATTQSVLAFDQVTNQVKDAAPTLPERNFWENTTAQIQDVKLFLKKEVQVASGTFTTSTTRSATPIFSVNFPSALLTSNSMYTDKLAGFQGIRGTIRVRMVVNSTDMHEGGLRTAYLPMKGFSGTSNYWTSHTKDILQVSYLRGSYFDLSTDRVLVEKLPALFTQAYYDLTASSNQPIWGTWSVYCEAPLVAATGASTSVPYVVYASFDEDVEVVNPTYTAADGIAQRSAHMSVEL